VDEKRGIRSEVEELKREMGRLQDSLSKSRLQVQSSQEKIQALETQSAAQQDSFMKERQALQESLEITLESRLKEEKQKWEEEQQLLFSPHPLSSTLSHFLASPLSPRMPQPPPLRQNKSISPQPEPKPRSSIRSASYTDIRRPSRLFSPTSFDASPPLEDEDEREFMSPSHGDSPKNTVVDAVSVSASTNTAGPSVNMMERMSSAVRRLETQVSGMKEEMARAVRQRDEAREECANLMSEVEEKRRFQEMVRDAQSKHDHLEIRFVPCGSGITG